MKHHARSNKIIVPYHSAKEVKKGLLQAILKEARIKIDKR